MALDALHGLLSRSGLEDFLEIFDQALRSGDDVQNAFALSHRLRDSRPMQRCLQLLQEDPEAQALIRDRVLMPDLPLADLLACPRGSLGHTFGCLARALDYEPGFYAGPAFYNDLESDADYVNYRAYATHDLHHVLTGFNFDQSGELGVISLSVGQYAYPGFAMISLVSLLANWMVAETPYRQLTSDSERIRAARYKLNLINQGLAMAAVARPLFALDWPSLLNRDLEDLRAELHLEPVRQGLASWYSRPVLLAALA